MFRTSLAEFAAGLPGLAEERFGPAGLVITYPSADDLLPVLARLGGNLAGVIHADAGSAADLSAAAPVADVFARTVGRVVWNGWPTGVAVTWAQHHGGPWPATTDSHYTSVGRHGDPPLARPGCLPGLPAGPAARGAAGPWPRARPGR